MDYNIFCVGDSITYGLNDAYGGWCDNLKKTYLSDEITNKTDHSIRVWNMGISGQTIVDFIEKDQRYLEPLTRIKKSKSNIFIIAFGANDAAFDNEKQDFLVPLPLFESSLIKLIKTYSKYGKILLLNITPISQSIENIPDKYNCQRSKQNVDLFNKTILKLSTEENCLYLDINKYFMSELKLLSDDGLHPNSKGHLLIATKVKQTLESICK
jgi:lysophospholipase L1-like esterase